MNNIGLLLEGLREPIPALSFAVTSRLTASFPERALIESDDCDFDLLSFYHHGHCLLRPKDPDMVSQIITRWRGSEYGARQQLRNQWLEVEWQGHTLDVVGMTWPQGEQRAYHYYWILADTPEIADGFFAAVCAWTPEIRSEVLVYEGGTWHKSRELYAAIQSARFDNLVLPGALKHEIRDDLVRFLGSRAEYEGYGIPWKRGILLIGPPGNGKTHCVKALINHLGVPCLYVKSFKSHYDETESNIGEVFERARATIPCLLVLEDLDSLIDDRSRSFFLNELDGFASNAGILTIATTNHPERLDPSIVDRPSRFDRKYHFELPAPPERAAYIAHWNGGIQPELRLTEAGLAAIVAQTEEFSFAYLKELFVSALMRWINVPHEPGGMDAVMAAQATLLREQMSTMDTDYVGKNEDTDGGDDPDPPHRGALKMRRYRRK